MKYTREHIKNLLLEHGVQPSNYRIRILECLSQPNTHPTADEIFHHLVEDFPTLSKMTVYNTLDVLLDSSLVRKITMGNNEARYDGTNREHGHFKCQVCHQIFNFDLDLSNVPINGLSDFKIDHKDVYFFGTCKACSANESILTETL
jgi:Fur family transcriptional regulator, peroxide stress response regulator